MFTTSPMPGLHILIDATMDRSATFIEEFQSEMKMRWSYADTTLGEFTLSGSRQAFQQVVACQTAHAETIAAPPDGLPANAEAVSTSVPAGAD